MRFAAPQDADPEKALSESEEEEGDETDDDDDFISDDIIDSNSNLGFMNGEGEIPKYLRWIFERIKEEGFLSNRLKIDGMTFYDPLPLSVQVRKSLDKGYAPTAEVYYYKRIHIIEPHITHNCCKITCTSCHRSSTIALGGKKNLIRTKGWTKNPRMVYGNDDIMFVFTRVYYCSDCKTYLFSHNPEIFSLLPYEVQSTFPFVFSKRSGITLELLYSMMSDIENGTGIKGTRNKLQESYMLKYQRVELDYYSTLLSLKYLQQCSSPKSL